MPGLKLGKLPDRTPVKVTITVPPELNQALQQYAELYRATYGNVEAVAELIPFMLGSFLESDREFAKARKDEAIGIGSLQPYAPSQGGRRGRAAAPPVVNGEL